MGEARPAGDAEFAVGGRLCAADGTIHKSAHRHSAVLAKCRAVGVFRAAKRTIHLIFLPFLPILIIIIVTIFVIVK